MHKILEELWYGNISPQARPLSRNPHYAEAIKMMCKNEDQLKIMLDGKEKETFEKFCDCRDEADQYNEEEIFIMGFRLGARIIIETLCESGGLLSNINA